MKSNCEKIFNLNSIIIVKVTFLPYENMYLPLKVIIFNEFEKNKQTI